MLYRLKYRDIWVAIRYAYRGAMYRDASMHRCIVTPLSSRVRVRVRVKRWSIIIYVHTKLYYKQLFKINEHENWEGQFIEVSGGGMSKKIIIGNIYGPNDLDDKYKQFINELSQANHRAEYVKWRKA